MTDPARLVAALADRYRIERELGQGGMATVYLAHDLRHDRRVAIKVLRPELAAVIGAERFLSEIRTTANLQHPHILPLHDSGEADSFLYYVMPFVEGESLRDRLSRDKQLPVHDAVRITSEVAGALDYAHRHGVIHRDIKPENILLNDGRALVADFGIALAASAAGSRMTETGMSLGTPMYMSPEQAMGERVLGPATDVYSLGCVLYEMLVGDPPFIGSTAQAIVAKVMTEKPAAPSRQRDTIPPAVEDAVLTALEKLPADRFATAAEFAAALGGGAKLRSTTRASQRAVAGPGPWRRITIALGGMLAAALAFAVWALGHAPAMVGPTVFDAALPDDAAIAFGATTASTSFGTPIANLSVSRDGSFAVYAARQRDSTMLWRRSLRDASARAIDGTRGGIAPRISPDGSRVAYLLGAQVMVVPVDGGDPELLLEGADPRMLEWVSPSSLVLIDFEGSRLSWLDPEGSQRPRSIATNASLGFGHWIPEDRQVLSSRNFAGQIFDPETGETWPIRSTLPDGSAGSVLAGSAFRIVDGAYLVYMADGDLRAAPYDRARHLAGRSVTLVSDIRRESVGAGQFDLTADGALVYAPGADATVGRIVRLRPGTEPEPLPIDSAEFQRFDLSTDRRWLAAVVATAGGQELRIHDLRNGQRINWLRAELIRHALWSPEGRRLIVGARDSTQWRILSGIPTTGMPPETLYSSGLDAAFDPVDYRSSNAVAAMNWTSFEAIRFDPGAEPIRFDTIATNVRFATLSPDQRHIMYTEESGGLVVASYPGGGRRWQVTADGAEPLWMSASEILFRRGVSWYLARLDPATGEPLGAPTLWGRDPRFSDTAGWSNRLSHDGGIIYLQGPAQVSGSYLRVIPNWVAQMKAAVAAANR